MSTAGSSPAPLPPSTCCAKPVTYSAEHDNFYCTACKRGQGEAYYHGQRRHPAVAGAVQAASEARGITPSTCCDASPRPFRDGNSGPWFMSTKKGRRLPVVACPFCGASLGVIDWPARVREAERVLREAPRCNASTDGLNHCREAVGHRDHFYRTGQHDDHDRMRWPVSDPVPDVQP